MQELVVITIVLACGAWMALYAYRFVRPQKGGGCVGGCCDAGKAPKEASPAASAGQTVFFPADDLARRLKSRRN